MLDNSQPVCEHLYEQFGEPDGYPRSAQQFKECYEIDVGDGADQWRILFGASADFNPPVAWDDNRDEEYEEGIRTVDTFYLAEKKGKLFYIKRHPYDGAAWNPKLTTIPKLRVMVEKLKGEDVLFWWRKQFEEVLRGLEESTTT